MNILRSISEWLTLLIGIAGLLWILAVVSTRALDAVCRAFQIHKYFLQFVFERHQRACHLRRVLRGEE